MEIENRRHDHVSKQTPQLPFLLYSFIHLQSFSLIDTIMSLPIPSSAGSRPLDPKQLQAMDAPLIALTQQCGGDLRRLMFAFFSFLNRRTDFYLVPHPDEPNSMGFKEGDAEKLLLAAFRQFPLRRIPKKSQGSTPPTAAAAAAPKAVKPTKPASKESTKEESTKPPTTTTTTKSPPKKKSEKDEIGNMAGVEYNEEGLQIPVGNGGSTKQYKWTQTIDETSVLIAIPDGLRGKDLNVKITSTTLSVKSKQPLKDSGLDTPFTFVEGKLPHKVRVDESTWSVEGGVVIVTLDKLQKTFWKSVLEGDEQIDTDLVDNRRHIGEYDDVTQAQIRKCIFDQQQYHKGLPSSDEIIQQKTGVPPLPPGVEFIDKKKLDEEEKKKKEAKS